MIKMMLMKMMIGRQQCSTHHLTCISRETEVSVSWLLFCVWILLISSHPSHQYQFPSFFLALRPFDCIVSARLKKVKHNTKQYREYKIEKKWKWEWGGERRIESESIVRTSLKSRDESEQVSSKSLILMSRDTHTYIRNTTLSFCTIS